MVHQIAGALIIDAICIVILLALAVVAAVWYAVGTIRPRDRHTEPHTIPGTGVHVIKITPEGSRIDEQKSGGRHRKASEPRVLARFRRWLRIQDYFRFIHGAHSCRTV